MASKEELAERVAELEREQEKRKAEREFDGNIANLATMILSFLAGLLAMVFWHAPIPGFADEAVAVVAIVMAGVGITVVVKDALDEMTGGGS